MHITPILRANSRKHLFYFLFIVSALSIIYLFLDYRGPKYIRLHSNTVFGLACSTAKDLIVQEYDKEGNLMATRGMLIYQLNKGDNRFIKVAHVPTGFSLFWLRNFTIIRKLTIRPECIEITKAANGAICALSAGRIWYRSAEGGNFTEALKLSHYGIKDQGIRNDGIVCLNDSTIEFGEYYQNPQRTAVQIYESRNYGKSWKVAYAFAPGQIRHIHALQVDPYTDKKWICTGDLDKESAVSWSADDYHSIQTLGQGDQIWRVCQLVFTEDAVYWGTDTGIESLSGIYRWNKQDKGLSKLLHVNGAVFFATRLRNGTIIMSTDRENMANEKDDRTRLYIISPGHKIKEIICGTWNHHKPGFWFKFAMLRFQRDQGGPSLVITCLNQKEIQDGDLIIIPEEVLQKTLTD
jgi:hypothetical protein